MEKSLTIVGGGLAGLACGIRLQERGWRVTVHERQRYPLRKVCGEFLSPNGWARVKALGAAVHLGGEPRPLRSARFYSGPKNHVDFSLEPHAFGLSRAALDQALAARFRDLGGVLLEGSALDPATPGALNATGRVKSGGPANWVGWKAYLGAAEGSPEMDEVDLIMVPVADGYAGLSRIEDGRIGVCLVARAPAVLSSLLRDHPILEACSKRLKVHAAIAGFAFGLESSFGAAGDARRIQAPVTGDGMAQALRDGESCALRLDGGRGAGDWAATARHRMAWAMHELMLWGPGRSAAIGVATAFPGLATRIYRWSRV